MKIIPANTNIQFIGHKNKIFIFSLFVVISSICFFFIKGLNYGIDFKGGYVIEARFKTAPDLAELRQKLAQSYHGDVSLQQFGNKNSDVVIKMEKNDEMLANIPTKLESDGDDMEKSADVLIVNNIKKILGEDVTYRKVETIGPTVGKELVNNAIKAVLFSILAIALYIAIRFEWQFAVCGLIALAQDCIGLIGAYAFLRLEFNATAIVAILTTASYSINDTIVIFDRIRENIRRYQKIPMPELINKSINETLSRTVLTSGTTLLAILALCIWGGEVISNFSIPILIGIALGTFSSIALAAPLLLFFKVDRDKLLNSKKKPDLSVV